MSRTFVRRAHIMNTININVGDVYNIIRTHV